MFGYRTPFNPNKKPNTQSQEEMGAPEQESNSFVRRSIGDWETGNVDTSPPELSPQRRAKTPETPRKAKAQALTSRVPTKEKPTTSQGARGKNLDATKSPKKQTKYISLTAEAKACLVEAKTKLEAARNLRTDIKIDVTLAVERLYQIVKESEKSDGNGGRAPQGNRQRNEDKIKKGEGEEREGETEHVMILAKIEEQTRLIHEQQKKLEEIHEAIDRQRETYASKVAIINPPKDPNREPRALHSVIVTSKNQDETGDEVLERIRKAVDAKEGWIRVEKVRKAKDRKVIMGCGSEQERKKIKERLEASGEHLIVEDVKNKDPLLILRDVLKIHSDNEVLKALRNQNREVFDGLNEGDIRVAIKYRRIARNPHNCHIVLTVSPSVWRRALDNGKLRVDLQRVVVEDQSPLVQCTRCLGYGHGKKLCKEPVDLCSHCGGAHLKAECPDVQIGESPVCINCTRAKMTNNGHNAFSNECSVRKRWDALARATIAYC
ncbi:uncharacterized protein [Choristoneura fumiferana]|uniref:uncharacterized protein n=1 Tax=Choristoneura fumiferana TaxID=7141 RepID=UPI003D155991